MSRRILMEGILEHPEHGDAGCVMYPEVAYVVQPVYEGAGDARRKTGERAYFFRGGPKNLTESFDDKSVQIVENYEQLELVERELRDGKTTKLPKDGKVFVEGPYQRSDVKNANQRVYPRKVWERLIGDQKSSVQQQVVERRMIGHLEHPKDGRTDGKEGALLNVSLKLNEDGVVWGKSELLDTPNGLILQEYTRKGVKWGVSSRGSGTVGSDGRVNENDFMLVTFDAVMNPSTPGAFPTQSKVNDDKKTAESADTVSKELSEDVRSFMDESSKLQEVNVAELSETDRLDFARRLVSHLGKANSLAGSNLLTDKQRNDLADWLARKLREATEPTTADLETAIDEAMHVTERDAGKSDEVVIGLRKRLVAACEDAEMERAKREAIEAELNEARQEREKLRQSLSESETERKELARRLELMESLLADKSEQEVRDRVEDEINRVVGEVKELDEFRDILEQCATPDEVEDVAKRLTDKIAERKLDEAASAARSFTPSQPLLPVGLLVESEVLAHKNTKSAPESHGAKLAAQVVAGTKPRAM